ncbi:hypothetical protein CR513_07738, partial [Mucuna pruriens]
MCKDTDNFLKVKVRLGNNIMVESKGKRHHHGGEKKGTRLIKDVLLDPNHKENLLSIGPMMEKGYALHFEGDICTIYEPRPSPLILIETESPQPAEVKSPRPSKTESFRPYEFVSACQLHLQQSTPHRMPTPFPVADSTLHARLHLLSSSRPSESVPTARLSELYSSNFEHVIIYEAIRLDELDPIH